MKSLTTALVIIGWAAASALADTNAVEQTWTSSTGGRTVKPAMVSKTAPATNANGTNSNDSLKPMNTTAVMQPQAISANLKFQTPALQELSEGVQTNNPPTASGMTPYSMGAIARLRARERRPAQSATKYGGIIGRALRTENPLQLINPFAPTEPGQDETLSGQDPVTGAPKGLVFFAIHF